MIPTKDYSTPQSSNVINEHPQPYLQAKPSSMKVNINADQVRVLLRYCENECLMIFHIECKNL